MGESDVKPVKPRWLPGFPPLLWATAVWLTLFVSSAFLMLAFGSRLLQVNTKNMYSNAAQLCTVESLTISKNAPSKEHAICMQAFLHAAKPLATINEKPNKRNTFKASKSAHYKVPKPVKLQKASLHTQTRAFCFTAVQTTDSWWHGFSWSGSPRHGLLSRVHVAEAEWNTVGQRDSSPNSWGILGKVWVKSSWQF